MSTSVPVLAHDLGSAAAVVALVVLAWLLGGLLLASLPLHAADRLEGALLAVGSGLGLLCYLAFGLGALSLLSASNVIYALIAAALLAGLGGWAGRGRKIRPPDGPGEQRAAEGTPAWAWALVAVGGLFLLMALVTCFSPMVDYDGLAYHVAAPKRWLELGSLQYLPTHLQTQWPMGAEMLYMLLLPVAGATACKPLIALITGFTAVAIVAFGARLGARNAGIVAAVLFVLFVGLFAVPGINSTSIESALAFYTVLSALALAAWTRAETPRHRRAWLVLAAIFAGFACCAKLNGLLILVFLALAILTIPRPAGERSLDRLREGLVFAAIALLCASPWYIRTWLNTGNPVFPFTYGLLGGRYWSAEAARRLADHYRSFNLPGNTMAARQAVVVRHLIKFGVLALIGTLLPGPRWVRLFAAAAGVYILIQIGVCDQWRMFLPAIPFAALVIGWWFARVAFRWPAVGWITAAILAVYALPPAFREMAGNLPAIIGRVSPDSVIQRYANNRDAFFWANSHLPAGARILYGPDNRTYYLQRPVYWSSAVFQHRIVYDTPQAFTDSVRREGIAYLILNRRLYRDSAIAFDIQTGRRANEQRRLEEAAVRSTVLWQGNDVTIYRLP